MKQGSILHFIIQNSRQHSKIPYKMSPKLSLYSSIIRLVMGRLKKIVY